MSKVKKPVMIGHSMIDEDGIHILPDISMEDAAQRMMAAIKRGAQSGMSKSLRSSPRASKKSPLQKR